MVRGRVWPLPQRIQVPARGLEFACLRRPVALVSQDSFRFVCVLHALIPGARRERDGGAMRIRRGVFRGGRARSFVWRAVPPGKIGSGGHENPEKLLRPLMLTKRISACL